MNFKITKVATRQGVARFRLRVWEGGRNGAQIKRHFQTRSEAQNFLDRMIREEKKDGSLELSSRTFGTEYAYWREQSDSEFAPGWRANLDGYWSESKDLLENCKISKLEEAIEDLRKKWAKLSQKTINNKMGFIYAVLNFSVSKKRIPFNPLGTYRKPKHQRPDIQFWEQSEAEDFLNYVEERYAKTSEARWRFVAVMTVLNTGMRAGELWALRRSDIKPTHGSIRLTQQLNRVTREFSQLKGKEARSVPLSPVLFSELKEIARVREPTGLIFLDNGNPVNHDVFHDSFDRDIRDWGGRRITFHGLRHTAATLMLLSGVDIKSLQDIMGHQQISTTMRYVHAVGDSAKRVGEQFSIKPTGRPKVLKLADFV